MIKRPEGLSWQEDQWQQEPIDCIELWKHGQEQRKQVEVEACSEEAPVNKNCCGESSDSRHEKSSKRQKHKIGWWDTINNQPLCGLLLKTNRGSVQWKIGCTQVKEWWIFVKKWAHEKEDCDDACMEAVAIMGATVWYGTGQGQSWIPSATDPSTLT
jgi:hypothetical protein